MSHWRGRWIVVCHIGVVGGWLCVTLAWMVVCHIGVDGCVSHWCGRWMVVCHIGVVGGWLCVTLAWYVDGCVYIVRSNNRATWHREGSQ